ncbi:DUF6855 family protein [Glaciibacter flavus]|uniref:DUF6855 family protein n=1 Tax=Orlajensenia flava TaxID=2565934 RepID=UPI0038B30FCE
MEQPQRQAGVALGRHGGCGSQSAGSLTPPAGGGGTRSGWYGLRKGYRGRFGRYLPPLLEELELAELTHDPRNNRIRARLAE